MGCDKPENNLRLEHVVNVDLLRILGHYNEMLVTGRAQRLQVNNVPVWHYSVTLSYRDKWTSMKSAEDDVELTNEEKLFDKIVEIRKIEQEKIGEWDNGGTKVY